jgi:hypothetical protein
MDSADIAGLNDYNDETVARARTGLKKAPQVERGVCLYCEEKIADTLIYCDTDCMKDHQALEQIQNRQHKRST